MSENLCERRCLGIGWAIEPIRDFVQEFDADDPIGELPTDVPEPEPRWCVRWISLDGCRCGVVELATVDERAVNTQDCAEQIAKELTRRDPQKFYFASAKRVELV